MGRSLTVVAVAGVMALAGWARAEKADPKAVEFFEAKIRPILATSCVGCHGADKQKGGLRLDTREALLAGASENGKTTIVVVAGDPEKSKFMEAVGYKNDDIAMPPPKKNKETGKLEPRKLSQEQLDALGQWIKMGAPYGEKAVEPVKK